MYNNTNIGYTITYKYCRNVTIDDIIPDYIMCAYVMSVPNTKCILNAWVCFHVVYSYYRIWVFTAATKYY